MFFEVVWEIRKPNLLQILPVIFSFEEIPVSLLLWIFEPCQNLFCYESYSAHFVTLFWILSFMLLFAIHFAISFFFFPVYYFNHDVYYLIHLTLSLKIVLSSMVMLKIPLLEFFATSSLGDDIILFNGHAEFYRIC